VAKNIFFIVNWIPEKWGALFQTQQLVNFYFILLIPGGCIPHWMCKNFCFIPAAILFYCPRILLFGWLHFFQKWIFWISFSGVPIQFGLEFGLGRSADEDFWSIKK